jgi:hypothetical protein
MQRFCRKAGIRPYRPTYRFLRGDPVKQAEAAGDLAELRERLAQAGHASPKSSFSSSKIGATVV